MDSLKPVCPNVGQYLPAVWSIARRLHLHHSLPDSVLIEDLVGEGAVALVECSRRYDAGFGVEFVTFSWPRVRGAMLDFVRRQCRHTLSRLPLDNHLRSRTDVEQEVEARQTLTHVAERIRTLPVRRRRVMESVIRGEPLALAADDIELPLRKTRSLLRSTRASIRMALGLAAQSA